MPSKELRKKIGSMFLMGFEGRNITPYVKELISRYHVGGLVLFSRNISEPVQAWELLRSMKSRDLLKCIDHEGGRVVRLPPPVTRFPPAGRFGELGAVELVRRAALFQGRELAALGFNFNFAPVLDVGSNPLNRVIADRSFSPSPATAGRLAAAYISGLHEAGVAGCGKHFPGHGDSREDSHEVLPRLALDGEALAGRELLPFAEAIRGGIKAIMTAHVVYEGIDPGRPATLSESIVGGLLRRQLGFAGVIVTDDLEMSGVADHFDLEDRTILAVRAGVDMLMFCHSPEVQMAAIETLYRAVDGRIVKAETIDRAHARIQELRAFARRVRPAANRGELEGILNDPEHKALAASLGEESV